MVVLVFFFLFKSLYQNWKNFDWNKLEFNFFYFILSILVVLVSYMISIYLWKLMLAEIGERLRFSQALRIVGKAQLGKYLPGGVWMTASRVYLAEQEKLSKSKVLLSSLVEQEYVFATALVLSILLLGFQGSLLKVDLTVFNLFFLILAVIFLNPFSLNLFLRWGMNLFHTDQPDWKFGFKLYAVLILGYSLCWMLQGLGFFFLIGSFYTLELAWLKRLVGIYLLSWIVGFVAIFAPGGLGVREGTMVLLLQGFFPTGLAVTISLASRIWTSILELLLAGLAFASRIRK